MQHIDELIERWKGDSFEVTYKDRLIKQLIEYREDIKRLSKVSRQVVESHYGYCPKCRSPSISRYEDGNDKCDRGHIYPSDCAIKSL